MLEPLYTFVTRQYRPGWRYLDQQRYVGTVKVLAGRVVREPREDYDEGRTYMNRVVAPSKLRNTDLTRAIIDTLSGSSCQHEHDCCGCAFYHVDVKRIGRRDYVVTTSVSYNL